MPRRCGLQNSSLAVLALLVVALAGAAQQDEKRIIRGQVLDKDGKPVQLAIVHLKNTTTDEEWSVVTNKEGRYQFNDMERKHDYEIYAEWRDQKSRTRKISQFDTRPLVRVNLRLKPTEKSDDEKEKEDDEEEKEEKD